MAITNNFVACMVTLSHQYCRVPSSAYFVCVWCRKLVNLLVDVEEWGQVTLVNMLTRYARTQFQVHRVIMVAILTCSRYLGFFMLFLMSPSLYLVFVFIWSPSWFCFLLAAILVFFYLLAAILFYLSSGHHLDLVCSGRYRYLGFVIFWPLSIFFIFWSPRLLLFPSGRHLGFVSLSRHLGFVSSGRHLGLVSSSRLLGFVSLSRLLGFFFFWSPSFFFLLVAIFFFFWSPSWFCLSLAAILVLFSSGRHLGFFFFSHLKFVFFLPSSWFCFLFGVNVILVLLSSGRPHGFEVFWPPSCFVFSGCPFGFVFFWPPYCCCVLLDAFLVWFSSGRHFGFCNPRRCYCFFPLITVFLFCP